MDICDECIIQVKKGNDGCAILKGTPKDLSLMMHKQIEENPKFFGILLAIVLAEIDTNESFKQEGRMLVYEALNK